MFIKFCFSAYFREYRIDTHVYVTYMYIKNNFNDFTDLPEYDQISKLK